MEGYLGNPESFGIHPGNEEALRWFLLMGRRWIRCAASGELMRLDDAAIAAQMQMRGIGKKKRQYLLDALMVMESAVLEIINKKTAGKE